MAAKNVDLLRMRFGSSPSVAQAITRPNISFLRTSAGSIRIRDTGGNSPSVVFACDAPNVLEHYDAIFALLSPSYRLISLEMPGFGFSYPNSSFDFSLQAYVNVIADTIRELKMREVTLMFPCAWSYVAFQLATEQPELVDRLIVSQCPHWDEEQAWTRRVGMNSGLLGTPVIGQLFNAWAAQSVSNKWYDNALPAGKSSEDFALPARKVLASGGIFCLATLAQTWAQAKNVSFNVTQPTVVMWGASDRTHRRSNPDSVLEYLQRGKILVFPEAGHFPELEAPQNLKDLLTDEKLWSDLRGRDAELRVSGVGMLNIDKPDTSGHAENGQIVRKLPKSHL